MANLNNILRKQVNDISLAKEEISEIKLGLNRILEELKKNILTKKIKAEVFIGGSFAKNTLIRKKRYDIDIFVRFNEDYSEEEIEAFLGKIIPKNSVKVHGSRDYFRIKQGNIEFEIIPVLKIKNPSEARNVTDLSYFHVNYVKNKITKNKKLADEIRLAKREHL